MVFSNPGAQGLHQALCPARRWQCCRLPHTRRLNSAGRQFAVRCASPGFAVRVFEEHLNKIWRCRRPRRVCWPHGLGFRSSLAWRWGCRGLYPNRLKSQYFVSWARNWTRFIVITKYPKRRASLIISRALIGARGLLFFMIRFECRGTKHSRH